MQRFRPEPIPDPIEDPWYASRLPDQTMMSYDRLAAPAATYGYPELPLSGPYGTMYPQDELSRIKMRNRRFMNACAQDMYMGNMQMGPMMQAPPMMQQMWGPPTLDCDLAGDELGVRERLRDLYMSVRTAQSAVALWAEPVACYFSSVAQMHVKLASFDAIMILRSMTLNCIVSDLGSRTEHDPPG